jgi:hypothetical protein
MDIPVSPPFRRELRILGRDQLLGYPWREDEVDEVVAAEGYDYFMDMEGERGEACCVGKWLDGGAQPFDGWDRKWIVHVEESSRGEDIRNRAGSVTSIYYLLS